MELEMFNTVCNDVAFYYPAIDDRLMSLILDNLVYLSSGYLSTFYIC